MPYMAKLLTGSSGISPKAVVTARTVFIGSDNLTSMIPTVIAAQAGMNEGSSCLARHVGNIINTHDSHTT